MKLLLATSMAWTGSVEFCSMGWCGPHLDVNFASSIRTSSRASSGLFRRHGVMSSSSIDSPFASNSILQPNCSATVLRIVSGSCTSAHGLKALPLNNTSLCINPGKYNDHFHVVLCIILCFDLTFCFSGKQKQIG